MKMFFLDETGSWPPKPDTPPTDLPGDELTSQQVVPQELLVGDIEELQLRWRWVQLTNTACTKEVYAEILRQRAAFRNKPRLNEVDTDSPTLDTDFEEV
jgi:hypothetical protein